MNEYSLFNLGWLKDAYKPKAFAYYYKTWEGFEMKESHAHNQVEIMYVLNGECFVEFDKNSVRLKNGEFILIDSGVFHRLIVGKDLSCRMLNLEFGFVKSERDFLSFEDMFESDKCLSTFLKSRFEYLVLKDTEEISHTLKQLIMEHDRFTKKNKLLIETLFYQVFISIARLWSENSSITTSSANEYIKASIDYIHQYYDNEIKVNDIAKYININENYLQRVFKKNMNITIIEYLNKVRMEKARLLLKNTEIPVIDICDYVGINSRQYFSNLFKKYFGISPQRYRKSKISDTHNN